MRSRSLVLLAVAGIVGLAGCGDADDGGRGPVEPVEATALLGDPGRLFYDVSPDGKWISSEGPDGTFCLTPTDAADAGADEVCADVDDLFVRQARWSPSSERLVVVNAGFITFSPGPLVVIGVDGSVERLVEPDDPDDITGSPLDAVFVDEDTILYATVNDADPIATEIWTIGVDGDDQRLLATFDPEAGSDDPVVLDPGIVVDGDDVFAARLFGDERDTGIWRLDLGDGSAGLVRPAGEGRERPGESPIQIAGERLLVADLYRLGDYGRNAREGGFWRILDRDGDVVAEIPDRGFYRSRSVALSPDGEQVAVLEQYEGERVDGEVDPRRVEVRESTARTRLSIATVESLESGEPDWYDLDDLGMLGASADFDGQFTTVVWAEPDRLLLELQDALLAVRLEPAG